MRKFNRINSFVIALTMLMSMFSMISVSAASFDGLTLTYTFANNVKGVADGTVKISGITEELQGDITNVNIYWGKSSTEALDGYYNLKYYTVLGYYKEDGVTKDETADNSKNTKLEYADESLTYVLSGNMAIPNNATHIIAEVIGTTAGTKQLSVEIPAEKRLNLTEDKLEYAMIWASDIHLKKEMSFAGSRSRKAVQSSVRISDLYGDKFKGMIINGDIADSAKDYEYAMAEQFFRDYGIDFPVYYTTGNHDTIMFSNGVSKYDESNKAMLYRFNKLEEDFGLTFEYDDTWSYETTIGGHHYIFFESPVGSANGVGFTNERKAWLEEKISMYEKSGEPTFVFTHYPYAGKLSRDTAGFTFNDILERHPSVTVITSHVHMELNSDFIATLINDPATGNNFIDTASLSYTNNINSVTRYVPESRVVEVYDDVIILKSIDNSNDTWIPRGEYILNVNGTENPFEGTFTVSSNAEEGTMAAGTVLTAKLNGADVPEGYTVTWYDMLGTELGTSNTYTVAVADASVSAKIVKTADNSYAYSVARYIPKAQDDGSSDEGEGEAGDDSLEFTNNAVVKYYADVVNVTGDAGVENAGKDVTVAVAPSATYTDESTFKYLGTCTVGEDGKFLIKFKADNVNEGDIFLANIGNTTVTASNVTEKLSSEKLVEVSLSLDATNKVLLDVKNMYADIMDSKLIIATYDANNVLLNASVTDYKLAFGENGELQKYTSASAVEGATVKAFLWRTLTDLTPLSQGESTEIPVIQETAE